MRPLRIRVASVLLEVELKGGSVARPDVPKQLPSYGADRPLRVAVHLRDPDRGNLLLDLQYVQLALEVPEKLRSMVVEYASGFALRPSEHLVEHAAPRVAVDTPAVMDTHVEQLARVDIDETSNARSQTRLADFTQKKSRAQRAS